MNRDQLHLTYVLETIAQLQEYAQRDGAKKAYEEDWVVQAGILYKLQTLSESASKLSIDVQNACPDIPWPRIKAMRNAVAHGYLGELDLETVWKTIQKDLEELKQALQKYQEKE
jgi:uncharacterized protein with HEPN domain